MDKHIHWPAGGTIRLSHVVAETLFDSIEIRRSPLRCVWVMGL